MKTKEKIIQVSLELFNQHGERAVTTNHIAAHLGISPGNLYYHFRNKEDIINSIFVEYIAHMDNAFQPESGAFTMESLIHYCNEIFESIWRFRFFYASLPGIVMRDVNLHKRYLVVQEQVSQRTMAIVGRMRDAELLTIDEEQAQELVQLLKLVVAFWVSYQMSHSLENSISKKQVFEGVVKFIALIRPYATPSGENMLETVVAEYRQKAEASELAS